MPTRMERREARRSLFRREAVRFAAIAAAAVIALLLVRNFIFSFITVQGASMLDTLNEGQVVLVDKIFFALHTPKPGIIVICRYPGSEENYVKRVIALPGDVVQIEDGITYVNGVPRDEDYVHYRDHEDFGPYVVEEGCVFVMGDNRANSHDSRAEGAIPEDMIVGRVFAVLFPAKEAHFLPVA